jgi:tetratricopeptide (TPR) repeat protein
MRQTNQINIFVASPSDVKEARDILLNVIQNLNKPNTSLSQRGFDLRILRWEDVAPTVGNPEEVILKELEAGSWDILIGIIWMRFGTPTGMSDEITGRMYESGTEQEFKVAYELSRKTGRPKIMFYRCIVAPPNLQAVNFEQLQKVHSFFEEFHPDGDHPGIYRTYESHDDFKERVREDIENVVLKMPPPVSPGSDGVIEATIPCERLPLRAPPFMPPPLPRDFSKYFVGRESLITELKERLFHEENIPIHGLSGIGKTSIAISLAYDPEVRQFFTGGILWAALGKEPDVLAILGSFAKALGIDSIADVKTIKGREKAILEAIGEQSVLIVIDDAWDLPDALSLKLDSPKCTHVLLTQDREIALGFSRSKRIEMQGLREEDSLKLLGIYVPMIVKKECAAATKLVNSLNNHPLALVLTGQKLRRSTEGLPYPIVRNEINKLLSKGAFQIDEVIKGSYEAIDDNAKITLQILSLFPPKPNSFSTEAALTVLGKAEEEIDALIPLFNFQLLETNEDSSRFMLNTTIAEYARKKITAQTAEVAYQRMVNFFVNYIEEHETDYSALELERVNITTDLEKAYELDLQEAFLRGVNAFYHFMATNGLFELAKRFLTFAENAARSIDEQEYLITTFLHSGEVALIFDEYEKAEYYYNESLRLAKINNVNSSITEAYKGLANIAFNRGQYDKQEKHCESALEQAQQLDDKKNVIDLYISLGEMEDILGHYIEAKDYFTKAMQVRLDDGETMSNLFAHRGWVYAHLGDFEGAKQDWEKGAQLARKINHKKNISFLYSNLGWIEDRWGNYSKAEVLFRDALKIAREMGFLNMIGTVLTNIAAAKIHEGDYSSALMHLNEGLDIVQKSGHAERTGVLLENLAIVASRQGKYNNAEKYFDAGLQVAQKVDQKSIRERITAIYSFKGELALQLRDFDQAKELLLEGLKLAQDIKNPERLSVVYRNLGVLFDEMDDYEKGSECLQKALDYASTIQYQWLIGSIYNALGEHYWRTKEVESAERHYINALEIGRRINSKDLVAISLYGLARTKEKRNDNEGARKDGKESLAILEGIGHFKALEVGKWLDSSRL